MLHRSNLSGLPEGWVTGGKEVELVFKDSEVSIIESRAMAGYAEDAQVQVTFDNTNILTVQMVGIHRCGLVLCFFLLYGRVWILE